MERIALIGYRGSGKSTVGPLLAQRLNWRFRDADAVLEANAGRTIAQIFADGGEPAFRDLEAKNLESLLQEEPLVLATGGGMVLRESNRVLLRASAFVIWLDADAATCWRRISEDATSATRRPNLAGGGMEEVQALLNVRRPFYEATAHLRVEGAESPEVIVERILSSDALAGASGW